MQVKFESHSQILDQALVILNLALKMITRRIRFYFASHTWDRVIWIFLSVLKSFCD